MNFNIHLDESWLVVFGWFALPLVAIVWFVSHIYSFYSSHSLRLGWICLNALFVEDKASPTTKRTFISFLSTSEDPMNGRRELFDDKAGKRSC
jgi:hypothetical protein